MSRAVWKASSAGAGLDGSRLSRSFAAQRMRKGEIATIFDLTREGQAFVDARQRAVRAQRLGLEFREQNGMEISPIPSARIGESRQRPPKLGRTGSGVMKATARPSRIEFGYGRARTAPRALARDRPRPPPRSRPRRGPRAGFPDGISIRADGPSTGRGRVPSRAGSPGQSVRARVRPRPVATWSWRGRTTQSDRWRRGSVPGSPARDRASQASSARSQWIRASTKSPAR